MKAAIGGESGPDAGRLFADDRFARLTVRIPGHPPARAGGSVELAIDPSQVHLFDSDTGRRWSSTAPRHESLPGASQPPGRPK